MLSEPLLRLSSSLYWLFWLRAFLLSLSIYKADRLFCFLTLLRKIFTTMPFLVWIQEMDSYLGAIIISAEVTRLDAFIDQHQRWPHHHRLLLTWLCSLSCSPPQGNITTLSWEFSRAVVGFIFPNGANLPVHGEEPGCEVPACRWTVRSTSLCTTTLMSMSSLSSRSTGELRVDSATSVVSMQLWDPMFYCQ
jgi:hypothetical protein